jgi:cellulose 1,4-beta-cellobiosidase
MNTTSSAVPYALSLTVTGTSGTLVHTASTTLLVNLAPPASLTATAGSGQVSLSWPASVGASGYHLKRGLVSGGPYVAVSCPTGTSYVDSGLTNGTTYYYVVSASFAGGPDAGGESADSTQASATPTVATPAPPTGLVATPGDSQGSLTWNASAGATSYNVKRSTTSGGGYTTVASPTSTSHTNTGLTNGTTYYYVVSAVNSSGESGNSSEVKVSATPQAVAVAPPTGLTASSTRPHVVVLHWTRSSTTGLTVTSNRIYRRSGGGSYDLSKPLATIPAATTYTKSGLPCQVFYCYVVTPVTSNGGVSPPSNEACVTVR